MIKDILISARPHQWYKNLLLFVGLIFSQNLFNLPMWGETILAFACFCGLSAGEYLINDVVDTEKDKKHPTKSKRPIASGRLKPRDAVIISAILITASLTYAIIINIWFFLIALSYTVLVLLYSFKLKNLVIFDVIAIAVGFVIRAVAGCLVIGVNISSWLIICVFLLALFLALGKRRHELVVLGDKNRISLTGYSPQMLDQLIGITAGSLILSYLLYTVDTTDIYLLFTSPFVIYGLFRYLFLVHNNNFGGEPELIFKDKSIGVAMGLCLASFVVVLYRG